MPVAVVGVMSGNTEASAAPRPSPAGVPAFGLGVSAKQQPEKS